MSTSAARTGETGTFITFETPAKKRERIQMKKSHSFDFHFVIRNCENIRDCIGNDE